MTNNSHGTKCIKTELVFKNLIPLSSKKTTQKVTRLKIIQCLKIIGPNTPKYDLQTFIRAILYLFTAFLHFYYSKGMQAI